MQEPGPVELVRLAHVARRYYLEGRSRVEIAEELGLSRFKIARLLDEARERGIVTISVAAPGAIDGDLSRRLREAFGLRRAIAVATPTESSEVVQHALGRVAAQLLEEIVHHGDVVGLTAGRTLSVMAESLTSLSRADVVQLAGVAGPIQNAGVEVIRRVSAVSGGDAYTLYAPLVVSDPDSARAIRRQPDVRRTIERFEHVSIAMVAIGSWNPPDSQMFDAAAVSAAKRERLLELGVQADIGGVLIAEKGRRVEELAARCIAASAEHLRAVPDVIGVAGGSRKTAAVRAALDSGLVGSLVTDAALAERLLA